MQLYNFLGKEEVYDLYMQILEELEYRKIQILDFDFVINSILIKIGEGGFGKVFKGKINQKEVAIKIAKKTIQNHQQIQECLKEIIIAMELKSDYLLQLRGICIDTKNQFCFVTDLMSTSLDKLLYQGQKWQEIDILTKLRIALQIANGIKDLHLHPKQIIHRDLKPENILLDENFNIKIADFGMSKFIGSKTGTRQFDDHFIGTIQYMAPELFTESEINSAVDIWAFGCILNELFNQSRPWKSLDTYNIITSLKVNQHPEISKALKGELRDLVQKCFNIIPDQRPKIVEIVKTLKKIIDQNEATLNIDERIYKQFTQNYLSFQVEIKQNIQKQTSWMKPQNISLQSNYIHEDLEIQRSKFMKSDAPLLTKTNQLS